MSEQLRARGGAPADGAPAGDAADGASARDAADGASARDAVSDAAARVFEQRRTRLRAIAHRMLGSTGEADDAVQETWLRFDRQDRADLDDLDSWLTTVVSRVSLNMLRARRTRGEQPLDTHIPDPVVAPLDGGDPEHEAMLSDAVGLALAVVLETLKPAERLAFVLHDMFGVGFDDVAAVVERSPQAARQLASRARARVRTAEAGPDTDPHTQRRIVEAYLAAAREGEFDRLLTVLDPDIVLRRDAGEHGPSELVRGAATVARRARAFARGDLDLHVVLVNGAVGIAATRRGRLVSVGGVLVRDGRITALDFLLDRDRLDAVDVGFLTAAQPTS